MRKTRVWSTLGCCLLALATVVWAQNRKAGLWEMTTTIHAPQPQPGSLAGPTNTAPQTTQVCLSQALIDRFGAPLPVGGENCKVTSLHKNANSMTAEIVCSGHMSMKETVESTWTADHATGSVHYSGSMLTGGGTRTVDWTSETTSVLKSADCGSVKPYAMPN
jgi:hypothetical protein